MIIEHKLATIRSYERKDKPMSDKCSSPHDSSIDAAPSVEDPLSGIDQLMQKRSEYEDQTAERGVEAEAERLEFSSELAAVFNGQVRPAMEAVLERLRRDGGGGVIEERPEDTSRHETHTLTLWMSLEGEISGDPRPDREPYLQLDADPGTRSVAISEGDMWQGHGGTSKARRGEWPIADITTALVLERSLAILRRCPL